MYISTKTYGHELGLSCTFRQWRAESHCKYLHGYAVSIRVEFEATELDNRNWVVDFGGLKGFKQMLKNTFDHKTLVATNDPEFTLFQQLDYQKLIQMVAVDACGCEAFAKMVYGGAEVWLKDNGYGERVAVRLVEFKEHGANSAIYTGGE